MTRISLYVVAFAVAVAATPGLAGTKISGSLTPVPADCNTGPGFCKNGLAGPPGDCGLDNSLCTGATTMKGKLSLKDKGAALKVSVSKLTDNNGDLVTTDPLDPLDDHILTLSFDRCLVDNGAPSNCGHPLSVYVKLDLNNGKGKAKVDLSLALADPPLTAIGFVGASLSAIAQNIANCPGTNSAADVAARVDDADCGGGLPYALYGIVKLAP
jgi:hypothetical protein